MSIYMATTIKGTQIDLASTISSASGNLLQAKSDGLYAALAAAANLQNQYVSSSTGNDANAGTRAAPLKTLAYAISRLPDNTSGSIYLLEGDVFPIRQPSDAQTWGGAAANFGSPIVTGNRSIIIWPYGPQTDSYAGLDVNAVNFYSWMIPSLNRPILEFGHYVFQGRPVGTTLVLGGTSGQCTVRGCTFRWTPEARALATSSGQPWASGGYQWLAEMTNCTLMGCVFPTPIKNSAGNTLNYLVRFVGISTLWNTSVPDEAQPWGTVGTVSKLTFLDSGTMVANNGTQYSTVPNSVTTNVATRITGISRDANGTPRNILANAIL